MLFYLPASLGPFFWSISPLIGLLRLSLGEVSFPGGFIYSPFQPGWLRHPLTTPATQLRTGRLDIIFILLVFFHSSHFEK